MNYSLVLFVFMVSFFSFLVMGCFESQVERCLEDVDSEECQTFCEQHGHHCHCSLEEQLAEEEETEEEASDEVVEEEEAEVSD
jgi:hypothetical protein